MQEDNWTPNKVSEQAQIESKESVHTEAAEPEEVSDEENLKESQAPKGVVIAGMTRLNEMEEEKREGHASTKEVSDVLLIVTGGTLCMVDSPGGYVPQKGLANRLKQNHAFYDREFAQKNKLEDEWLVTPVTPLKQRIRFKVLEFDNLIDSSCIKIEDQIKIATTIQEHYKDFDGFVVCHGTDTMAYTSSYLSFMLENLNKTVVITGSQIPISELRNDAVDNLLGALLVAGPYLIPEVVIFFGNRLLRGNRATKESSTFIQAFNSPNIEPLAKFGVHFDILWDKILKYQAGHFSVQTKVETNISYIQLSPCLNLNAIELVLKNSKSVIMAGYGMGNLPTNNEQLMRLIKTAADNGVIIVIKTQCYHGSVDDVYATGRLLTQLGCILAMDMTIECLFAKLSYLLGKGFSNEKVKKMMSKNLRGELTDVSHKKDKFSLQNNKMVMAVAQVLQVETFEDIKEINETITPVLINSVTATLLKKLHQTTGADLNKVDYMGRSAIHIASCFQQGGKDILDYISNQPINLDQLDMQGRSALYHAINSNNDELVEILVNKGATAIANDQQWAKILCLIGFEGNLQKLKLLHKCEVNLEISDYDLRHVAHLAACEGHVEILQFLIEKTDFNMNLMDRWGSTAFDEMKHKVPRDKMIELKKKYEECEKIRKNK